MDSPKIPNTAQQSGQRILPSAALSGNACGQGEMVGAARAW